mmetsp:Transcript_1054/g.2664  ORF Transcript_1054/g.2664 Transcript_1054/m.2664 type:complete len:286 (-) Transcript_1054:316-1173(-)
MLTVPSLPLKAARACAAAARTGSSRAQSAAADARVATQGCDRAMSRTLGLRNRRRRSLHDTSCTEGVSRDSIRSRASSPSSCVYESCMLASRSITHKASPDRVIMRSVPVCWMWTSCRTVPMRTNIWLAFSSIDMCLMVLQAAARTSSEESWTRPSSTGHSPASRRRLLPPSARAARPERARQAERTDSRRSLCSISMNFCPAISHTTRLHCLCEATTRSVLQSSAWADTAGHASSTWTRGPMPSLLTPGSSRTTPATPRSVTARAANVRAACSMPWRESPSSMR